MNRPHNILSPAEVEEMLQTTDIKRFVVAVAEKHPSLSPLCQYALSMTGDTMSPDSGAMAESLTSIVLSPTSSIGALSSHASEYAEMEDTPNATNELIYKLCYSLYKKAVKVTRTARQSSRCGRGDAAASPNSTSSLHGRNMNRPKDWMPLLHLFHPKAFYDYHSNPVGGSSRNHLQHSSITSSPTEATRMLMDELDVEKLSGGNSNHVYRLSHPQYPEKVILLRVYGSGGSEAIDRYRDGAAMHLMSEAALSPEVLHTFRWGRVEEYMDNVATCTTDMLLESSDLLAEIYGVLRQVHQLDVAGFLPASVNGVRYHNKVALNEENPSMLESSAEDYCQLLAAQLQDAMQSSLNTDDYYRRHTSIKVLEEVCPSALERATCRFLRLICPHFKPEMRLSLEGYFCNEIASMREVMRAHRIPVVFSHNDLNPGNILLSWRKVPAKFRPPGSPVRLEEDADALPVQSSPLGRRFVTKSGHRRNLVDLKGVLLIDFEYSDANYSCFDLGNTICELDYDYGRGTGEGEPGFIKYLCAFPPPSYAAQWHDLPETYPRLPQLIFDAWERQLQVELSAEEKQDMRVPLSCLRAIQVYYHGSQDDDGVTREHLRHVFLGMLGSHLHWSLWSFVMGCNPDVTGDADAFAIGSSGLDYMYYGNCRLGEYIALKKWMKAHQLL